MKEKKLAACYRLSTGNGASNRFAPVIVAEKQTAFSFSAQTPVHFSFTVFTNAGVGFRQTTISTTYIGAGLP
jgi:hypothetical protein